MKLPGIDYGTAIQGLGRENVRGPIGVAKAQASAVSAQVNSARQVAGDTAAIGRIHQRTAGEIMQSQRANINRTQQFANDLGQLAKQGGKLTVDLIEADVATDMQRFKEDERNLRLNISEQDLTYKQYNDPNDESKGFKMVSMAPELVPEYQKQMTSMMDEYEANANWMARGMMREQMEGIITEGEYEMRKFSIGEAKDFAGGQYLELMDKAIRVEDFGLAREYHSKSRNLFTGVKNASIAKGIDDAENVNLKDNQAYDSAHSIMAKGKGFAGSMAEAEKIKDKEVRQGAIAIIQRTENTRKYAETQYKAKRAENVSNHMAQQMQNLPPNEWMVHPDMTPEQILGFKKAQQDGVAGYATKTIPKVYSKWALRAANNPEAFRSTESQAELLADVGSLNTTDFKKFQDMMLDKGDTASGTKSSFTSYKVTDEQMTRELNVISPNFKTKHTEMYAELYELVQKEVDVLEQDKQGKATPVEVSGVLNRVLGEYTDYEGWDTQESIRQNVPANLINPLADFVRNRGDQVTAENMTAAEEDFTNNIDLYRKRIEDRGITNYSDDDLVDMYEIDVGIRSVMANLKIDMTAKNVDTHYNNYISELGLIDKGLVANGYAINTQNRLRMYELGRK